MSLGYLLKPPRQSVSNKYIQCSEQKFEKKNNNNKKKKKKKKKQL